MSPSFHVRPLPAAALAFVCGLAAVTAFLVIVFGDAPKRALLSGAPHAGGAAIGVYLAAAAFRD